MLSFIQNFKQKRYHRKIGFLNIKMAFFDLHFIYFILYKKCVFLMLAFIAIFIKIGSLMYVLERKKLKFRSFKLQIFFV